MSDKKWAHLYNRAIWRGPNGVRGFKLRRDPICEMPGCDKPATVVDHRIPHRGDWTLFIGGVGTADNPFPNLVSMCKPHHDEKTAKQDGAFGNPAKAGTFQPIAPTGEPGRQYLSSSVSAAALDKAIGTKEELDELLKDIPA